VPLQQFHLVREHVLALLASEPFAGKLPVVPGESLAVSDIAQAYLLQAMSRRAARPHGPPAVSPATTASA
jgi:hypothetical protein